MTVTAQQYATDIQRELGDRNSLNEEYLILVKWAVRIQSTGFKQGLERAAQVIASPNPEARSPNTEIRNQCRGEILREIH